MNIQKLGKTGIHVSELCFGTLTLSSWQANLSVDRAGALLAYGFEKGINFLDTAQYYQNYPQIYQGLKRTNREVVVATKTYAWDKKGAEEALEQARRALDRDVIDIFLLHEQESIHTLRGHEEALDRLYRAKADGQIRAVGISTHCVAGVKGAMHYGLDIVHPLINLTGIGIADGSRQDMERAIEEAYAWGIGIYTMKALGGGNLFRDAEAALQYAFSLKGVQSRAIGMQSEDEVDANVHFCENNSFTRPQKLHAESKKRRLIIEEDCIACGNCQKRCQQKAIELKKYKKRPVIDDKKCVLCGYCAKTCPVFAIKVI